MNVVTIVELEGMPKGSVLQNCVEKIDNDIKYWVGTWCSMWGSYIAAVKQTDAEEIDGN